MLQGETGNREESFGSASGRAAIAMAAVRIGMYASVGKVTDRSNIRPPTDVMAITSLPVICHRFSRLPQPQPQP